MAKKGAEMPAMICSITKDESRDGDTFIIRMYDEPEDIGQASPIDAWECREIFADEATLDYLNDRVIVDFLTRRKK